MQPSIALFGALGLIGCFLPFGAAGDGPAGSWWQMRDDIGMGTVCFVIAAYAAAVIIATRPRVRRASALVAAIAFGLALTRFWWMMLPPAYWPNIGAIAMAIASIGGAVVSLRLTVALRF